MMFVARCLARRGGNVSTRTSGASRCSRLGHGCRGRLLSYSSSASTAPSSAALATKAEIESLRAEIRTLQKELLQTTSTNTNRLAQQFEKRSLEQDARFNEIHERIVTGGSAFAQVSSAVTDYVQHNESIVKLLQQLQHSRYSSYLNKKTMGMVAAIVAIVWTYRSTFYQRTSEEVASIASQTLQQETLRQTIRETLNALATSPDTLATLNHLLQTILRDPATVDELTKLVTRVLQTPNVQESLLNLLQMVFTDKHLQQLAGEFLLKGLDIAPVKQRLQNQTQDLVKQTVSDESVQKATGDALTKSVWYALTPNLLKSTKQNNNNVNNNDNNNHGKHEKQQGEPNNMDGVDDDKKKDEDTKNNHDVTQSQETTPQ